MTSLSHSVTSAVAFTSVFNVKRTLCCKYCMFFDVCNCQTDIINVLWCLVVRQNLRGNRQYRGQQMLHCPVIYIVLH